MKLSLVTTLVSAVLFSTQLHATELRVGINSDPETLDIQEQLTLGVRQFAFLAFDPLIRFNNDLKPEGRLATSWEQISPTVTRFHLRQGVTFQSGNPFTADDVVWTYNRLVASDDFKGLFDIYSGIKKIDDYTVELTAKKPYPLVLQSASFIVPMDSKFYSGKTADGQDKAAIRKASGSFASTHVSGSGPFKLVSYEPGIKLVMERNPNYWDKASGNVDKLSLISIKEDATRAAALLTGDVDMIEPVAPNDEKRIASHADLSVFKEAGDRIILFELNQNSAPEFKNLKVRQAVNLAINKQAIEDKILKGFGKAAGQLSPEGYLGHVADLKPRYDLQKAKELMKEAGYEHGFKISMLAPNNRYINDAKMAEAVAAQLAKINIKVELKTLPKAQFWPEFDKCSADMLMLGWSSDTVDSGNYYEYIVQTREEKTGKGQYNCNGYSNANIDALITASNQETDVQKRTAQLQTIEKNIADDAVVVPIEWQKTAWAAKKIIHVQSVASPYHPIYYGDIHIATAK